jgi:DNA-binding transcriptional regulator GbsR (MarR family)
LGVCDAVGQFIEWWGFKAIHGRIWVLLALRGEPLPQSEIAELLGVSRSLVSTAIGELVDYRLVRAATDHRNAPYEATMDVWSTITDVLRAREWMIVERVRMALEAAVSEAESRCRCGEAIGYDLQRLRLLLRMTELAQMLLRMLIALGTAQVPRGLTAWLTRAVALTGDLRAG